MNISRQFLKADMKVQTVMLSTQILIAVLAFSAGWAALFWIPIITFFLGVYQWGISAVIHITGLDFSSEPIKRWRRVHIIGAAVYLAIAISIVSANAQDSYLIWLLIIIPQLIGYAYYGLTIWDYRVYAAYRDNVG
jgi:hypothetical protein